MTDNTTGWGQVLAGGLVGYFLGNNGGLFGNNNCGKQCNESINAKIEDLMESQDTKSILDASIAGDSQIRSDIGNLTKDVYELNIQQLIGDQSKQRDLDHQFCKTREFISAENGITRAAIENFKSLYQADRYNDIARENAELKNKLNIMPLECAISSINGKLDDVMCKGAVRTCSNSCYNGNINPYTVPPLVGTATSTNSYNPSVPTA